jgi:serine/threonine protein kinase
MAAPVDTIIEPIDWFKDRRLKPDTKIGDFRITGTPNLAMTKAEIYYVEPITPSATLPSKYVFKYQKEPPGVGGPVAKQTVEREVEHEWHINERLSGCDLLCLATIDARPLGYQGFFMPYYPAGDLLGYACTVDFTDVEVRRIMARTVRGLDFMHKRGIPHLDLKPENILVGHDMCETFLSDFGLSAEGGSVANIVGTLPYKAPELASGITPYNGFAVDMWAIGVIAFVLFVGVNPFDDTPVDAPPLSNQEVRANICGFQAFAGEMLDDLYRTNASREAIDFISKLMVREPSQRLTAEQALKHNFLAAVNAEAFAAEAKQVANRAVQPTGESTAAGPPDTAF